MDRTQLSHKYAAVLAEKCAPQGDTCDYATARTVLNDMLGELGDPHTNLRDAEEPSDSPRLPRTGPSTAQARGWCGSQAACWLFR